MATVPVYRTWVAGEVVTAAYFNANVRDAGNFWLSVPTFEGRQTVTQSLTSGVDAALTYDTEDLDNDNGHSTVTNTDRYTPVTVGRFQVSGACCYATNATGWRAASVWKNGAFVNGGGALYQAVSTAASTRVASRTITEVANGSTDYFQIAANQNSGGALSTTNGSFDQSTFSVRWVGTT